MRTGLLTWAYPPEKSGLSRAAREIAEALTGAGADVRLFTLDRSGRETTGGVEVIGCAPGRMAQRLRRTAAAGHLVGPALFARAVAAEHARRPFDVVEATNWYAPGLFVGMAGGPPLVVRSSTPVATTAGRGDTLRDRADFAAARWAEGHAARRAAGLISNTAAHADAIARLYGVAGAGPHHAVVGLSLPPSFVARAAAATYPEEKAGPVRLLFVGRAERRKGFDALVAALNLLADRKADFAARLVGIAEAEAAALSPAARGRVTLHHRLQEDVLHAAFAAAHIVVAPSRYESFGLVYQEAMAFGRPIVACAEDPSARLFVGEAGAGVLAPTCTGTALADAIASLIADPARRARLAAASRAAAGRFDRASLARATLAAYAAATGRPRYGESSAASSSGRAPVNAIAP